ncbi:AlbA family DNA-binding domain-containing protein [Parapedobacter sp. 10938]|uniref:AlbA family DNA-binding domain-containing protein n=1 Tax=Parapedobacter flavus TaxID=3110225 RepID=UPI002DC04E1C|nr:RNA-binding domain-containing protein [Parapedobacter sp. 10938]MEC3881953.1 RNA-binding domain-containing protein [Parapedobacter sp. 10938]
MPLHININDLLSGRTVESDRIEYKKGWNPVSIYRSICAFANNIEDIGVGYVIIGVEGKTEKPVLPPVGVDGEQIDRIQHEMVG